MTETDSSDVRDELIGRALAAGGSFVDIGGLWGTVSEKVSVGHAAGATSVTMFDILPLNHPLWEQFRERMRSVGVATWSERSINLDEAPDDIDPFDVVHCSGVIYHCPNPLHTLRKLHALTRRGLVLTSMVASERMETDRGTLTLAPGQPLFVPGLQEHERAIVDRYLELLGVRTATGIDVEAVWDVKDYGPWWWLPTPSALEAMARATGYRVEASEPFWGGRSHTLLLSPIR